MGREKCDNIFVDLMRKQVIKDLPATKLEEARDVLVDSFFEDPWICYFSPDAENRRESLRFLMSIVVGKDIFKGLKN